MQHTSLLDSRTSRITLRWVLVALLISLLPFIPQPEAKAAAKNKATICHRTKSVKNPYRLITVSKNSISGNNGHSGHKTNPTSGVWTSSKVQGDNWEDIIPNGLNWTTSGAQNIYYGVTKTALGVPACRSMTFAQYYKSEIDAGRTKAQIAADLDDGMSDEDKAVLKTFGGSSCNTFAGCATDIATIADNSKAIAAVTTYATNVTATSATLNGYVKADSNSIKYYFEYSTDGTWNLEPIPVPSTPAGPVPTSTTTSVSYNLTGLTSGTEYFYRIVAQYTPAGGTLQEVGGDLVSFVATASPRYVVKYDANGGTDGLAPVDAKLYPSNTATKVLANYGNLTKNGASFIGWSLSPTNALRAGTSVQANNQLEKMKASTFYSLFAKMTFLKVSAIPQNVAGTYAGGDNLTVVTSDITLYALYSSTFSVTYNGNTNGGGSAPTDSTAYSNGGTVTVVGNTGSLTKSGYTFGGWCTTQPAAGSACTGTAYVASNTFSINSNVTLYAIWSANKYVYNGNTGSGTAPADQTYSGSTLFASSNTFTLTGKTFFGWCTTQLAVDTTSCGTKYNPGAALLTPETPTVTLYAIWSGVALNTITYDTQGGSAVPSVNFLHPETITLPPAPTQTGYTFNGWFLNSTGGTALGATYATTSAANFTIYAQWTINSYTITYDGNSNTGGSAPASSSKNYNETYTVLTFGTLAKNGYSFTNWNTTFDGVGGTAYNPGDTFTVTANVTLFAQWSAGSITVTYDSQGGNSFPNDSTTTGGTLSTSPGTPTRSGYTFNGWFENSTGGTAITFPYLHGRTSNFTLYAQWTQNSSGGGTPAAPTPPPGPRIDSISKPEICAIGNDIVIAGNYFDGGQVTFDGTAVTIKSISTSSITVTLPKAVAGNHAIRVTTANGFATTTVKYLDIPKPRFVPVLIPYLSQGDFFSLPISATNAISYDLIGKLPSGLSFNSSTGAISGTPGENGIFAFVITASGVCGDTSQVLELDIDEATPNAISHRVNILPGAACINDSAKASLAAFLERVKEISPRNLIPEIYFSGGGIASGSDLGDDRRDCLCELFLEEEVYGNVIEGEFTGTANRIEIIVYWAKP